MNETDNFMESHEHNDLIKDMALKFVRKGDNVFIDYHAISDGKHKVFINGQEAFNFYAWLTLKDLKEMVKTFLLINSEC